MPTRRFASERKSCSPVTHPARARRRQNYEQKLPALDGKRKRGRIVFERDCATCHRLAGKGFDVGPNLETIRHHAPRQVLANILDPGREVSPAYIEYVVVTKEGRTATGIMSAETATSITLRRPNDVLEDNFTTTSKKSPAAGRSLMPEGFEKKIPPQEMADLLAFLLGPKEGAGGERPGWQKIQRRVLVGWPGRPDRAAGSRLARQEAAPCHPHVTRRAARRLAHRFKRHAHGQTPRNANGAASCRCATRPPSRRIRPPTDTSLYPRPAH